MPKYTFKCPDCNHKEQHFVDANFEIWCEKCGALTNRLLPTLNGPVEVNETVDQFMGKKHRQGQKEMIKERNEEFFWSVEVPKLANDPKYSLETKLENGWVWVDDKGQINIHTKPPHKR